MCLVCLLGLRFLNTIKSKTISLIMSQSAHRRGARLDSIDHPVQQLTAAWLDRPGYWNWMVVVVAAAQFIQMRLGV